MATRWGWSILVGDMVVVGYTKQLQPGCCLRVWRRATYRFGLGWPLLFSFSPFHPSGVTRPSVPSESIIRVATSRRIASDGRELTQGKLPFREGRGR
jgi:hypothetical protein